MKRREAILRVGTILIMLSASLVLPIRSFAATTTTTYAFANDTDVIISELQTSTLSGAGQEFIELFNNTNRDIDLADTAHLGKDAWKVQYFSKTKLPALLADSTTANGWTSPFRTITLMGTIAAGDYYVLAADSYVPGNIEPDQTYSSTLADDGGAIQIIDSTTTNTNTVVTVHDRLAWSGDTTLPASTLLSPAPGSGLSLQRLPNMDSEYINDDTSLTSFLVGAVISPKSMWVAPVVSDPVTPDPTDNPIPTPGDSSGSNGGAEAPAPVNDGLAPPIITELLPNPAAPQTDEVNEYIELYNPNDKPFNLKGYTLETGETTLHDFTFTSDTVVEPNSYQTFYSAETRLSLSNAGGQARLLDASGTKLSETDVYTAANDGMAWALDSIDGSWKWTSATTPGAENLIISPAVVVKTQPSSPKTLVKTAKITTAKVKGVSTTKAKKAAAPKKAKKTKAKVTAATTSAKTAAVAKPAPIHAGVLAAAAVLAVGYGVYEYRHDLANRIYQFRTNGAARRAARK
jgi:hypothetical protein